MQILQVTTESYPQQGVHTTITLPLTLQPTLILSSRLLNAFTLDPPYKNCEQISSDPVKTTTCSASSLRPFFHYINTNKQIRFSCAQEQ